MATSPDHRGIPAPRRRDAAPEHRATPPQTTTAYPRTSPPKRPRAAPSLLTVRATADRLQVAEKTVRRLIAAGELPTHRIGGCVRVSEDDLLVFLSRARQ